VSLQLATLVGLISALTGALVTLATAWLQAHTQRRRESGTVTTADAQTVFQAYGQLSQMLLQLTQQTSERMRAIGDQLERVSQQQAELLRAQRELLDLQRRQLEILGHIEARTNGH
jgi:hypothetical protein